MIVVPALKLHKYNSYVTDGAAVLFEEMLVKHCGSTFGGEMHDEAIKLLQEYPFRCPMDYLTVTMV